MSQPSPRLGGSPEFKSTSGTRRSLFRSLSESKKAVWNRVDVADSSREGRNSHLRAKLQRRPSTSHAPRTTARLAFHSPHVPPPLPLSPFINSQGSKSSLGSFSESDHVSSSPSLAAQSTPDLPLRQPFVDIPNHGPSKDKHVHNQSSMTLTPDHLVHRKASMSKLMRHLGEGRIPPELILAPCHEVEEDANDPYLSRVPRAKSLDMRPLQAPGPKVQNGASSAKDRLTRTRSLGVRKQAPDIDLTYPLPKLSGNEELQRKLKLTRKITKIFGPEVTHDLMALLADGHKSSTHVERADEIKPGHVETQHTDSGPPSRGSPADLAYDLTDEEDDQPLAESEPTTPITEHPIDDPNRRVRKLAKFFGVDKANISSAVVTVKHEDNLPVSSAAALPLDIASVTEIDVQITGRRFWGSAKTEYKNAHMADAIHQLRSLKAA